MTDITTGPVTEKFLAEVNRRKSALGGLEYMAGGGQLGALAKELADLASTAAKSGYVPLAKRDEYERFEKAASSATDRETARYYRAKARAIRNQLGEGTA